MKRFVEGADRGQGSLFPQCLEDWIGEDNPIRVIDVFVEELNLGALGFSGVDPKATGRPRTTVAPFARSAPALSHSAARWACSRKPVLRSTAASSRG